MRSLTGMPNVDGSWPFVTARGDTLPGQHDGTPLLKRWMDELFGVLQAAMNGAGLTPSGTADIAGAVTGDIESCQVLQAIQAMFMPAGIILPLASATIPTGARLLACNGQVVSSSSYPRLVANTYCGNANNATAPAFYKTSDAGGTTRSTSGGYFVLPDLRGCFLRGYDPTEEQDPDGSLRQIGSLQGDVVGNHSHEGLHCDTGPMDVDLVKLEDYGFTSTPGSDTYYVTANPAVPLRVDTDDSGTGILTETRPVNNAFQWCITY